MPEKIIKATPPENDPVKHPNHYCYGKFECVEVIRELTAGASGPEGFLLGNVIKYLWRYRRKNGVEDLRKARRYIEMLLQMYEEMDGARADTAILDVAPGNVPIRDNRPVFSETTTWAAARLTGQNGEFFDAMDGKRVKGRLVKIENGLPAPYIAKIQMPDRYIDAPYTFFSPLPPEPENGRPVFNRAVAEGAARYIGKEGEFFDAPGGTRKRGILRQITGPACDFRFNASIAGEGRSIYAFFSPLHPEAENIPEQAPGMNRVVASLLTAASEYIIGRENPEALERLDDAVREIRIRTLREMDGNPENRGAHWAGKTAAETYFSWRSPEIPRGMMPEKTPCGRWYI